MGQATFEGAAAARPPGTTGGAGGAGGDDAVNILVVDDTPENRLTLRSILAEPGQNVVTAASGRDALRCLLQQEFAVILLDVNMPVMDGFETAALVRQRKSSERTPIIFITAFSDEIHISRGYSLGAVDYIVSPVVPEVLRSKVAVFVDLFRKAEQIRRQAESLRRRADQLNQLAETSLAINSANALDDILVAVTETARDLVEARWGFTVSHLTAGETPAHRAVTFAGEWPGEAAERDGLVARATAVTANLADQTRAVRVAAAEVGGDRRWQVLAGYEAASGAAWMAAPLTGRDGRNIGWVHLMSVAGGGFGDDDSTILTQLAQVAAIAIENVLSSEAREANRLKDEFLTTLSHELRTPLTAILGWTRVLRTSPPEAARLEHGLEVIERNVMAQTKLIEDLLDVSRIIAGKLRLSLRPVALLPVLDAVIENMRPVAEAKGVALTVSIAPQVAAEAAIAGDADRLQQVGWNLVSNAIKFTPAGGRIEVSLGRDGDWFKLAVSDTGKGISPQFLHHVFDRFRQDDSSSTRAHGGLGLGLAIVQHIVELHGGAVEAHSPGLNLGATFTVMLRALPEAAGAAREGLMAGGAAASAASAARAAAAVVAMAAAASGPGGGGGGGAAAWAAMAAAGGGVGSGGGAMGAAAAPIRLDSVKVLVVDDEPDTREILAEMLSGAGAVVATAASAAEAVIVFDQFKPLVLLSDIAMPGGDGNTLLRQLRRRPQERGGAVPAIAVSAHAREEDRQRALSAGFSRYVTKPVEPVDLLAAVRELLPAAAVDLDGTMAGWPAGHVATWSPVAAGAAGGGGVGGEAAVEAAAMPVGGGGAAFAAGEGRQEPAAAADEAAAAGGAAAGAAAAESGAVCRILLVEDDPDTRDALKTLLEIHGHQVEVAGDGLEGVALALSLRPQVALIDIGLPELDGHEVAHRIRAELPSAEILLIALSGYSGEAEEQRSRSAGFDAHLTKPVELARLNRLLRAAATAPAGSAG